MKKDFIRFNTREYNPKHKLTVFLIAYNHENTIRDTIESILTQKQNCKHNFIVKILEDCSTDNTLKICQEYARKYPDLFELFAQPKNTHCEHIKTVHFLTKQLIFLKTIPIIICLLANTN